MMRNTKQNSDKCTIDMKKKVKKKCYILDINLPVRTRVGSV